MNDPKDIDAGSWLPGLIGPLEIRNAGVAVPKRQAINFVGATITDDAVNESTNIAISGGGGGLIVDADVDPAAAIAATKLAPGTNGQWLTTATGAAGWATPSWVNANIALGAAIAVNKLAAGTNGQRLVTLGGTPTWTTPTAPEGTVGGGSQADVGTTGAINDYALGDKSVLRFTGASNVQLSSIVAPSPAFNKVVWIINDLTGGATLTIKDASAALGTAANRILTGTAGDYTAIVVPKVGCLVYDTTSQRWRLFGYPA